MRDKTNDRQEAPMMDAKHGDLVFDTSRMQPNQRLRSWQDFIGDHLADVDLSYADNVSREHAFGGSLVVRPRGAVTFARVRSAHQLLTRTRQRIRRATHESVLMTLVETGGCHVTQNGRTAVLGPGDLCLYDSTSPYQITVPGPLDALIVMVNRDSVPVLTSQICHLPAIAIGGSDPAGRIAASFWRQLGRENFDLDQQDLARLARAGFDAVGAALLRSATLASLDSTRIYAIHRARTCMAEHFHRPNLSITDVARAAGLSVRRLQELFQGEGTTVGKHLRDLRIATARQRLADPALRHCSVARVAESVGLPDQAYFSRLFRAAHSMGPREYRRFVSEAGQDAVDFTPPPSAAPPPG